MTATLGVKVVHLSVPFSQVFILLQFILDITEIALFGACRERSFILHSVLEAFRAACSIEFVPTLADGHTSCSQRKFDGALTVHILLKLSTSQSLSREC